jgi:tetratricopeptide (TPR) repeat protein
VQTEVFAEGDHLGRYVLGASIGAGGMGTVYLAHDPELDREVAVKLIRADQASDPEATARLVREAQSLARLQHPSVVSVFEIGIVQGLAFIAMEYVPGEVLSRWQRKADRSTDEILDVYGQAGEGLAAAHAQDIIHRDFKPANVLVGRDGRARVLDFGIATLGASIAPADGSDGRERNAGTSDSTTLTRMGDVLGTPSYMSPEQHGGKLVDHRSDQYAFCVALFEALYGVRPFAGDDLATLAKNKIGGSVQIVERGRAVPAAVRRVIVRGLSADPDRRWPTMGELLAALESARKPRWTMAALGIAVPVVAAAGLLLTSDGAAKSCERPESALAGTWDPLTQQTLSDRFGGVQLPDVAKTWALVQPKVDEYAQQWMEAYSTACEAPLDDEVLDLTMACLHQRRTALGSVVDVLSRGELDVMRNAGRLVRGLPSVEQCAEIEDAHGRLDAPPAAVATEVERLRRKVGVVTALAQAGKFDEAIALSEEIARAQVETGYEPLRLEIDEARGSAMGSTNRIDDAITLLEQTFHDASVSRYHAVEARAASSLVYLVGSAKGDGEGGERWARQAQAAIEAGNLGDLETAGVEINLGSSYMAAGRLEDAMQLYDRAWETRVRILGDHHPETAVVLSNRAALFAQLGRLEDAEAAYRQVIEIWEDELGPAHPAVSTSLNGLIGILDRRGRVDEAVPMAERSIAIRRGALGNEHPKVAIAEETAGSLYLKRGDYERAQQHFDEALRIREATLPAGHIEMGGSWINLGMLAEKQGRYEDSVRAARKAVDILENNVGTEHPWLAYPLTSWSISALALGHVDEAHERAQRALALRRRVPTSAPELARTELAAARVLAARGEIDSARSLAEEAYARLPDEPTTAAQRSEIRRWLRDGGGPPAPAATPAKP